MKKFLKEKFIIWGYVHYGLTIGDSVSYGVYNSFDNKIFVWFENQYTKLGYRPLSWWEWQDAGGYGKPYKHLLKVKYTNYN